MLVYLLCLSLFIVGIYGLTTKKNLLKIIMSFNFVGYSIYLFFILIVYRHDGIAPVIETVGGSHSQIMVDPVPQGLVTTAIIIEMGLNVILISLAIRLYQKYKTFDITEIRRLKG